MDLDFGPILFHCGWGNPAQFKRRIKTQIDFKKIVTLCQTCSGQDWSGAEEEKTHSPQKMMRFCCKFLDYEKVLHIVKGE